MDKNKQEIKDAIPLHLYISTTSILGVISDSCLPPGELFQTLIPIL